MPTTITYRRLDANWDPVFGGGRGSYCSDLDAVTQAIATKLKLWLAEWWESQDKGLPMWQSILGASGSGSSKDTIDALIVARILETPYVTDIASMSSEFDSSTREYTFTAWVNTDFGAIMISNVPWADGAGGNV